LVRQFATNQQRCRARQPRSMVPIGTRQGPTRRNFLRCASPRSSMHSSLPTTRFRGGSPCIAGGCHGCAGCGEAPGATAAGRWPTGWPGGAPVWMATPAATGCCRLAATCENTVAGRGCPAGKYAPIGTAGRGGSCGPLGRGPISGGRTRAGAGRSGSRGPYCKQPCSMTSLTSATGPGAAGRCQQLICST
jgi:hypothetical protein